MKDALTTLLREIKFIFWRIAFRLSKINLKFVAKYILDNKLTHSNEDATMWKERTQGSNRYVFFHKK